MFRMRWILASLLKMNKAASGLYQSLEEIRVARIGSQPKLLENIMRLVVTLLVPATEKRAIKWMLYHIGWGWIDVLSAQLRYEPRNPLAFAHEGL
jgi:hypothetical protein